MNESYTWTRYRNLENDLDHDFESFEDICARQGGNLCSNPDVPRWSCTASGIDENGLSLAIVGTRKFNQADAEASALRRCGASHLAACRVDQCAK